MTATRLTVENRTRFLVRREYRPLRVAALVGIVVIWEALSRSGWVSALFLPSPLGVLAEGVDMARSGELAVHVAASLKRLVTGFVVGGAAGIAVGIAVGFFRSSPELHSFAVFRCPETRPDPHAYETTCWNDIRDWADHMAGLRIKLWWGPGRHGPGNNLFFMVQDPQGYLVELFAELETVPDEVTKRSWRHEKRTLNLWGPGFMRS